MKIKLRENKEVAKKGIANGKITCVFEYQAFINYSAQLIT